MRHMSNFIGANKEDSGHRFLIQKKNMTTIRGVICKSLFELYEPEVYQIFQAQAKEKVLIPNISEHQIYDDDHYGHNDTMREKLQIVNAKVQDLDRNQSSKIHKAALDNLEFIYKWGHGVYKNRYLSLVNKVSMGKWMDGTLASEEGDYVLHYLAKQCLETEDLGYIADGKLSSKVQSGNPSLPDLLPYNLVNYRPQSSSINSDHHYGTPFSTLEKNKDWKRKHFMAKYEELKLL